MLEEKLNNKYWDIIHPKEGEIVIDGENIVNIKKLNKRFSPNARSVDVKICAKKPLQKIILYGFYFPFFMQIFLLYFYGTCLCCFILTFWE